MFYNSIKYSKDCVNDVFLFQRFLGLTVFTSIFFLNDEEISPFFPSVKCWTFSFNDRKFASGSKWTLRYKVVFSCFSFYWFTTHLTFYSFSIARFDPIIVGVPTNIGIQWRLWYRLRSKRHFFMNIQGVPRNMTVGE